MSEMRKWEKQAARMLRIEMARRGVRVCDLARSLSQEGEDVTAASLRNKLSRGTFGAGFLLRSLLALGCDGAEVGRLFDMIRSPGE
ncbi:hypothetical protein E2493_02965 [Sphingomonas parva]|uniref:DUF6471 domain-containing protein n=1 Tax=Sphingomonas parva TaxID=2555898 RepID=A0A4Y8ZUW1_9SPHN|nr:DUF6471 domain-containing protein [Sphingomonas parva]TFI59811.1 hypothetical protein E2493_02965 [Sphingomonas parva]